MVELVGFKTAVPQGILGMTVTYPKQDKTRKQLTQYQRGMALLRPCLQHLNLSLGTEDS